MTTPPDLDLPDDYVHVLGELKAAVRSARVRAHQVVNTELLRLYWTIGATILVRQSQEGWGAKVIERLSQDLRAEFPEMTGLSRANLYSMRQFAEAWPREAIVQQPVGRLPWGHVTVLLAKLADTPTRDWYAAQAAEHGWSRNVLLNQIMSQLHVRSGAAPSNFSAALPGESDLVRELVKDPYAFDFLHLAEPWKERLPLQCPGCPAHSSMTSTSASRSFG